MANVGIHGRLSPNCIAALVASRPVNSGTLSASVSSATSSANIFACSARRSPNSSVSAPPAIGSQISRLSRGKAGGIGSSLSFSTAPGQHGQQRDEAEDHGEGVVVEVAGLQVAQQRRGAVDDHGGAVDQDAVDQAGVAALAREPAEAEAAAREAADPQVVEAVLVLEQAHDRREQLARAAVQVGLPQVH